MRHRAVYKAGAMAWALLFAVTLLVPRAAQSSQKPLSKNEVIELLEGDVPPSRVAEVARTHGITFEMNSSSAQELRDAGADENLLRVLRQIAPKPVTEPPASSSTTTASAAPALLIEVTPGGAQVYIDDEPKATTSPAGRVRFSQIAPGEHIVRISLAGYHDYEQKVDLKAGQTSMVSATLEGAKPASGSSSGTQVSSSQAQNTSSGQNAASGQNNPPSQGGSNLGRFLVAHDHGMPPGQNVCVGWMTVGGGMVHFQGARAMTQGQLGGPVHSFDISVNEIKEAKKNGVYLAAIGGFHIRLKKGTNNNFLVIDAQGRYQPPDAVLSAIDQSMGR